MYMYIKMHVQTQHYWLPGPVVVMIVA